MASKASAGRRADLSADVPAPVTLVQVGELTVEAALSRRPWLLPVDTLVLAADGGLAASDDFRISCGQYWAEIESAILSVKKKSSGANVPVFVPLPANDALPPRLRNLIVLDYPLAYRDFGGEDAYRILELANRHKVARLGVPVSPQGRPEGPLVSDSFFRAIQEYQPNESLRSVILITAFEESYAELLTLTGAVSAATVPPSPAAETSLEPAAKLLENALFVLEAQPSDALRELFTVAGRLGPQRRRPNPRITTSLLLFAAVELGRRTRGVSTGADGEWDFLREFALYVGNMAGIRYQEVMQSYFGESLRLDASELAPAFETLSGNTRDLLRRARERIGAHSAVITVDACLMALLETKRATAIQNLKRMDIQAEALKEKLDSWIAGQRITKTETAEETPAVDVTDMEREAPPPARNYVSAFNNDDPRSATGDLIRIEDEVVAFARLAAGRHVPPPLSIGVFGHWGSGKTFFMERMYKEIESIIESGEENRTAFYSDIVQIRFNAWHYIESNLWASLVEHIFNELDRWLRAHNVERPQVDALFDQLATSRQLKLDAYRDLVETRRERKAAESKLQEARDEHEGAIKNAAAAPIANPWPAVAKAFIASIDGEHRQKLKQAADELGLSHVRDSVDELATLVDRTRAEAARGRIIANALIARLGSARNAAIAAGAVVLAPLAVSITVAVLAALSGWQWLHDLPAGVIGLASGVSAAIALGGVWLERARKGLNTLDKLRSALDHQVSELADEERRRLADAELAAQHARNAIAEAEQRLVAARDREISAKHQYDAESARGRLNRFIRSKVADESYAKHLGIIASIRKDFGQLTALMMPPNALEESLELEFERSKKLHAKKVEELIDANDEFLDEDEIKDLREQRKVPARSFERIILYIDDLDRCPPDKVVEVLQAIHMLLYFPLFVVVVAVDARWVSRALKAHYPELIADERISDLPASGQLDSDKRDWRPADAQDYLEKIFQIPYWVRPMDKDTSVDFVEGLARAFVEEGQKDQKLSPSHEFDQKNVASSTNEDPRPERAQPSTGEASATQDNTGEEQAEPAFTRESADEKNDSKRATRESEFTQMTLSDTEKQILADFAPFVGGSPRRAKRYLNLYLLLKTSLQLTQLRSDQRVSERAIIALLAIATGMGRADKLFQTLGELDSSASRLDGLLQSPTSTESVSNRSEARHVIEKLIEINVRDSVDQDVDMINALRQFAPIVRRYSF